MKLFSEDDQKHIATTNNEAFVEISFLDIWIKSKIPISFHCCPFEVWMQSNHWIYSYLMIG